MFILMCIFSHFWKSVGLSGLDLNFKEVFIYHLNDKCSVQMLSYLHKLLTTSFLPLLPFRATLVLGRVDFVANNCNK